LRASTPEAPVVYSIALRMTSLTVATSDVLTDPGQFSVNGQRASTNYFTVDGAGANFGTNTVGGGSKSLFLSGAVPGTSIVGGTSNLVSVDALEEFKIQTSTYSAESGRQPGGQVQIVTRSGKNQFRGLLFEYFRNEALDARNYFNKEPSPQTPLRQNQYGGTFSGPVFLPLFGEGGPSLYDGKDRTFFFFSYEAQRLRLPQSGVLNVPSVRRRTSAFPALRPLLNAFPIPTGPETTTATVCTPSPGDPTCAPNGRRYSGVSPFEFSTAFPSNLDSTGLRIDHMVNSSLFFFGRVNESPSNAITQIVPIGQIFANTRTVTVGMTFSPKTSLMNELRFNYSRQQAKNSTQQSAFGGAVPIDPGVLTSGFPGAGTVTFGSGSTSAQLSGGTFADAYQRHLNVVDNVSVVAGSHSLKFGADFRWLAPIYGTLDTQSATVSSESSVQNGVVNTLIIVTQQPSEPRFANYSVYGQDTWRVSKRLTLDLGLRWELNPPPTEKEGRMPPIALGVIGTNVTGATLAPTGEQFYKTFWTALAPRLGGAYQLNTHQGWETIVRGGLGVYYDLGSGTAAGGWPIRVTRALPSASFPACPSPIPFPIPDACLRRPGIGPVTLPTTSTVTSPNENLKLPYSLHWNLAVDQSLGLGQSVSVSYVASAGRRLLATLTLNQQPRNPVTGALLPRPNPNFGLIVHSFNGPTSDYHSMQTQYKVSVKQRLQAIVNYTWSHAIDEVSTDIQSSSGVLERGNANFDIRHNVSAAINYELPRPRFRNALGYIFQNWAISALVHLQSGRPVNVSAGTFFIDEDGTAFGIRPDVVTGVPLYIDDVTVPGGRRFNIAAFTLPPRTPNNFPIRQGNFGRNVLRELPIYQTDIALGRTFRFTESTTLQVKGEAFNVFNHPMFAGYGVSIAVPGTFGIPTTTLNSGLGGLSSLYQLGGPRSIQLSARVSF